MSSVSSLFRRPLLLYDDKCYSCTKFARAASLLSRGWIRTAGHYYSQEAREAKTVVFPPGYEATKMFWLINKNGAYGARSGLLPVVREIAAGLFQKARGKGAGDFAAVCEYTENGPSCYAPTNTLRRFVRLLSHGAKFPFS